MGTFLESLKPRPSESVGAFRERVVSTLNARYRETLDTCQFVLPREIAYSLKDTQSIEKFRNTLLMNRCRHKEYEPSFDNVFGRLLY